MLNDTHDPALQSWVASANEPDTDFPIQNLPFGRFRPPGGTAWRICTAIGDQVLDLAAAGLIDTDDIRALMAAPRAERQALRRAISTALRSGNESAAVRAALHAQASVELGLPCEIGDYTDFYTSIHHATTVGKQFRPDNPLLPNYKWVPIGYHGRASSIVVSGTPFHRPVGQTRAPDAAAPSVGPCQRLDYELELGIVMARPNALGEPVSMQEAEEHVFGIALFNDWSARDIQGWEYQPLGPFLSKNFASTLSPWIVTLEALAPFRVPFTRPAGDPEPLPYLDSAHNREAGAIAIELEVWLQTERMRAAGEPGVRLSHGNYRDAYWTVAQLVAHHTVNGCNLQSGDLLGSGTLSGPAPGEAGSLMELSAGGKQPIRLANGEQRAFLQDGDTLSLKAWCGNSGGNSGGNGGGNGGGNSGSSGGGGGNSSSGPRRIGFGACSGTVLPARGRSAS